MSELLNVPAAQCILAVLAMGALAYLLARVGPLAGKLLALASAGAVLAFGWMMLDAVPSDQAFDLLPLAGGKTLEIGFAVTHLGQAVVMLAAAFTALVAVYSFRFMAKDHFEGKHYAYLIWSLAGACLVGWAGNFFVLLLGWELVTLMLYLLLALGREGSERGAAKTFAMLGFGDACLLLAVVLMFALDTRVTDPLHNGAIPVSGKIISAGDYGPTGYAIYVLLLVAALAKAGAMPLHTWVPAAAEGAAAPVLAFLPGALDKLLGIYLLAKVSLGIFKPEPAIQATLMVVGAVTILAAVFMAMIQHNLKRLLSFHAVSQVGYMVLGIGTGTAVGVIGGLFHMVNNALYKSNLFLMSGAVGRACGSDDLDNMGGLARKLPVTFICGAIASAAISGIPPFNGFVSKWLIYQGALDLHSGLGTAVLAVAVFGSALTLASFVKIMYAAFLSREPVALADKPVKESFWLAAPMVVLAVACVVLGIFPQLVTDTVLVPALGNAFAGAAITYGGGPFAGLTAGQTGSWSPAAALGLIAIGLAGGVALLLIFARGNVRVVRPFLGGEIPIGDDRFRARGTGFYETVQRLPVLGGLLDHGERGEMDLYHWAGRHGETLVRILRDQHAGLLHVYVAWCIVGLAVVLMYVLIAGVVP